MTQWSQMTKNINHTILKNLETSYARHVTLTPAVVKIKGMTIDSL